MSTRPKKTKAPTVRVSLREDEVYFILENLHNCPFPKQPSLELTKKLESAAQEFRYPKEQKQADSIMNKITEQISANPSTKYIYEYVSNRKVFEIIRDRQVYSAYTLRNNLNLTTDERYYELRDDTGIICTFTFKIGDTTVELSRRWRPK